MGQQVQCLGGCMALRVRSQEWSHVSQLLVQLLRTSSSFFQVY